MATKHNEWAYDSDDETGPVFDNIEYDTNDQLANWRRRCWRNGVLEAPPAPIKPLYRFIGFPRKRVRQLELNKEENVSPRDSSFVTPLRKRALDDEDERVLFAATFIMESPK